MRYSLSKATSSVAMLRRHGRLPTDDQVKDAYRELVAANIEKCIMEAHPLGLPLDPERGEYLNVLLASRTANPVEA